MSTSLQSSVRCSSRRPTTSRTPSGIPTLQRGGGVELVEPTLRRQQSDDLADEERVALGLPVDRLDEGLGRGQAGGHLDVAGDVLP